MSDQQDPYLADAVRSVRALGEDRYGIEPDGDEHGAHRVHPAADLGDEEDDDDA
jgi:hypothetical protein